MIKDITIGQYVPGDSFIHKLDPRTKIISAILFIVSLFIINEFIGYIFVVAFIASAIISSKVSPRFYFKGIKPVMTLIIITAILNIFMIKGTSDTLLFSWKFIKEVGS